MNFNSHAHVERDVTHLLHGSGRVNFNSHAHVERDCQCVIIHFVVLHISTHTLTWSVTCVYFPTTEIAQISTHTLTWSVTSVGI